MIYPTLFIRFRENEDRFTLSEGGESKSAGYIAAKETIDDMLSSINERLKENTKPFPPNPKVYLGKTCKLDRDKIKTIFSTNKYSKTRVAEYADIIVLDKYNEYLHRNKYYLLDRSRVELVKQALIKTNHTNAAAWLTNCMLKTSTIAVVAESESPSYCSFAKMLLEGGLGEHIDTWHGSFYDFRRWGANKEVDLLNNMILCNSNEKAQILDSTKFNGDVLQKDLIIIDEEAYVSLAEMANSKQMEDTRMLANLIDNCNLKESHYFINLLVIDSAMNGTSKLSTFLRKETHQYLKTTGKKYFDDDVTSYHVKYILSRIQRDVDYKLIPRCKDDIDSRLLVILKKEITDSLYWLNDYNYKATGIENINFESKINPDDVLPF